MSNLPYSKASSGEKAMVELQKILRGFGCTQFGTMLDDVEGTLMLQFAYQGRRVSVKASSRGYAAAWLRENPYTTRRRCTRAEWEKRALEIGSTAVYSILRDWIKGQVMAVETGILTFEGAFLGQILLPSGQTVLERVATEKLLPAPEIGT